MQPDDEVLSRFLTSSNQFAASSLRVKPSAFMPPPDKKLSCFVTTGLEPNEIWEIADRAITGRPVYGSADIGTREIHDEGLVVERDDVPPRHVNILGWPAEKDAQKEIAQALAAAATLRVRQ